MSDTDYKIIESYMIHYQYLLSDYRKGLTSNIRDMNIKRIVEGITIVYNNLQIKEQQIVKLTWWSNDKYDDTVVAKTLEISVRTLKHVRLIILEKIAKEMSYI